MSSVAAESRLTVKLPTDLLFRLTRRLWLSTGTRYINELALTRESLMVISVWPAGRMNLFWLALLSVPALSAEGVAFSFGAAMIILSACPPQPRGGFAP